MWKLYWYFYLKVFWVNLVLSAVIAVYAVTVLEIPFLTGFPLLFLTVGYGMAMLGVRFMGRKTRYLYYNKGITSVLLYGVGFVINASLTLIFVINVAIWKM